MQSPTDSSDVIRTRLSDILKTNPDIHMVATNELVTFRDPAPFSWNDFANQTKKLDNEPTSRVVVYVGRYRVVMLKRDGILAMLSYLQQSSVGKSVERILRKLLDLQKDQPRFTSR